MKDDLSQAKRLIQECLTNKELYLDLGNCGITDLSELPELFECVHLDTLIFSNGWYDDKKKINSKNNGPGNKLKALTGNIKKLVNLKTLKIGRIFEPFRFGSNQISDISFLKELKQLNSLDLSYQKISDYSFLKELKQLNSLYLSYNKISDISFLRELKQLSSLDLLAN
ncbi:MAG: leucine-rich repeat domain-containing protein, partial [Ignavibacteriae bacterium]|nr:leucine-rich repeat domain-containing protein [Ignavibacteriota bacterium]